MANISSAQASELKNLMHLAVQSWVFTGSDQRKMYDALRHKFNITDLNQLPEESYYEALDFVEQVNIQVMKITIILTDLKNHAFKQSVLGGAPFTSIIVRKYRAQLDELPPIINWAQMMQALETAKAAGKKAVEVDHV